MKPEISHKENVIFSASTTFDETTILKLFRAEYYTYEKIRVVEQILLAILLCCIGVFAASVPYPVRMLLLLIGVLLFSFRDFASQFRAEGVLQQRKNVQSTVHYTFTEKAILLDEQVRCKYKQLDRLILDKDYYYLFFSPQSAVIFPKETLEPADADAFLTLLETKTGKQWETLGVNLMGMNLKDLCRMLRDRKVMRQMRRSAKP